MAQGRLVPLRHSLVAAAALLALAGPVRAQNEPRLMAIVRLAQDGLTDSARAELRRLMEKLQPTDSLFPEALYTSALVAGSDGERRLALRRVVVEHSTSAWADDALLLLAQLEYANGDPGGTVTQIIKLIEDYPLSPLRGVAAFWGARAAGDLRDGDLACRWADLGLAAPSADLELRNQLEYQKQRCQAIQTLRADSSRSTAPAPSDTAKRPPQQQPAKPIAGIFVQVAAEATAAAAERTVERLRGLKLAAGVVQEGGYHKVRAGPFPTRAAAQQALARIQGRLGGRPFIVVVR